MTDTVAATAAPRAAKRKSSYPPETLVSGFSWRDSTFLFYSLVNSVLKPNHMVLDYGAGRGAQDEMNSEYKRGLLTIKGKVKHIVGVDVDDAVLENQIVDESHVIRPGERLPFEDGTFDVIFSDWVIEHVDDPEHFAGEVHRLLKPGGWFLARTPNRWGAIAIAATIVPNKLHTAVLARLQPNRLARDIFPTRYRLNTRGRIARHFPADKFQNATTTINTELAYLMEKPFLFHISELITRLLPKSLWPVLIVAVRKIG